MGVREGVAVERASKQTVRKDELKQLGPEENVARETWGNQCEFFLSCLGYAVGFGNVWRFPYLCFKNGGAIFLVPYTIMLLCAGLPLFFMELALGQYASLGSNILFQNMLPLASGLGWSMVVISILVAIYYNMIFAWTLFYTFASFTSVLPWSHCNNQFNTIECTTDLEAKNCSEQNLIYYNHNCYEAEFLCDMFNKSIFNETHCLVEEEGVKAFQKVEKVIGRLSASEDYFRNRMLRVTGTTWDNMGGMNWELVGCLALAWIVVFFCMIKGVKSSGKVVYFTALFPYVVLVILFVRGIMLDGADIGIRYYFLEVKWDKLLQAEVWNDAATQIFYSLGSSFGALITLASYNKFKNNCMRDAIIIAFANCSTSVFAGFVIFSILGFMAKQLGVPIQDVVKSGSGLAFIAYPEAITKMPVPTLWALLFFGMLITLGLDSQFTMVETISTAILDQFESLRPKKTYVIAILCLVLFLCGLTLCLDGGIYMFELFNNYTAGISVLIVAITEIVVIQYVYGFDKFMDNIRSGMGIYVPLPLYYYWRITWQIITPLSLLMILGFSLYYIAPVGFGDYVFPDSVQNLGWVLCASSVILIPMFAFYRIFKCVFAGENLATLCHATEDFCPAHERNLRKTQGAALKGKPDGIFQYTYDNEGYQVGVASIYPQVGVANIYPQVRVANIYPQVGVASIYPQVNNLKMDDSRH